MDKVKDYEYEAAAKANRDLTDLQKGIDLLNDDYLGAKVLDKYENAEISEQKVHKDFLTGLLNRSGIIENFSKVEANLNRLKKFDKYTLITLDMIGLKKLNDEIGHSNADKIIIEATHSLSNSLRETDLVGRWGGDEFLIVAINTKEDGAKRIIEKINNNLPEKVKYCIGYKTFEPLSDIGENIKNVMNKLDSIKKLKPKDENGRFKGDGIVVELE